MLILSRKENEEITVTVPPSDKEQIITIKVARIKGNTTRLGFEADRAVAIRRSELDAIPPTSVSPAEDTEPHA